MEFDVFDRPEGSAEERRDLPSRLSESGWVLDTRFGTTRPLIALIGRQPGRLTPTEEELKERLALCDEEGKLKRGYQIIKIPDGALILDYEGPEDDAYSEFLEKVISFGAELDAKQIAESEANHTISSLPEALKPRHRDWFDPDSPIKTFARDPRDPDDRHTPSMGV